MAAKEAPPGVDLDTLAAEVVAELTQKENPRRANRGRVVV